MYDKKIAFVSLQIIVLSAFCFLSACAKEQAFLDDNVDLLDPQYTKNVDLSYAFLRLERGVKNNDLALVQESVETLLINDPKAKPLVEIATWYFVTGRIDDAQSLLKRLLYANPDDLNICLLYAEVLIEANEADKGMGIIQDFIKKHPNNTEALVDLAVLYIKTNQLNLANAIFKDFTEEQKTPTTRYYYAQSLRALGYNEEAKEELLKALEKQPDFVEAMRELALLEEEAGNTKKAISLYSNLLKYDMVNVDIVTKLLRLYFLEKQFTQAYETAQIMQEPLLFMLSIVPIMFDEGHIDIAQRALTFIKKKDPRLEEVYFYDAALAYELDRNISKALSYLEKIPKTSENYYKALTLIIELELLEEKYIEALAHAQSGLEIFTTDKDFFLLTLQLLMQLNWREEALNFAKDMADKALLGSSSPEFDAEVLTNYVGMLIQTNKGAESFVYYKKIFELEPDNYEAMNYLAYYYATAGIELEQALFLAQTAIELAPGKAHILDTLAWVQYALKEYKKAYENIRNAIAIQQEEGHIDPVLLEHYGFIAYEMGYKETAKKAFEEALLGVTEQADLIREKLKSLENIK